MTSIKIEIDDTIKVSTRSAPDGRQLLQTFNEDFTTFRPWWAGASNPIWRTTFGDGFYAKTHPLDRRSLPTNHELQLYVDPSLPGQLNPFKIVNGVLEISANKTSLALKPQLNNYAYTSGLITTQPSFNQLYGFFEARMKLPRGKGLWPAFWMLPTDQQWPPEIDIMESIGNPATSYWANHSAVRAKVGGEVTIVADAFHDFALSWDPTNLIWYIDGREIARATTPTDAMKPMYMLLNLAVGGDWPGSPDASTIFPAKLMVEHVKAYQFTNLVL